MSQERLAPQQPAACLIQSRKSTCKGGTVIAGGVWSLAEHRKLVAGAAGGYRQCMHGCPTCGGLGLHVHDYRERKVLAAMMRVVVTVVRFVCVDPRCRATWQVLPAFLARHLWWTWRTVEQETAEALPSVGEQREQTSLPEMTASDGTRTQRVASPQTRRRWLARLRASPAQLVQLMKRRGGTVMASVVRSLQDASCRGELVERFAQRMGIGSGRRYAVVAALVDDLERGVRLM